MQKSNLETVREELAPYLVTPAPIDHTALEVERLTMDAFRTILEGIIAKKFGGRYLLAEDVVELQVAVRAAVKKQYPTAVVLLKPIKSGGFAIEIDGL